MKKLRVKKLLERVTKRTSSKKPDTMKNSGIRIGLVKL